ncbi:MAG TPA: hypothetical protein VHL57_03860 [Flavobacteriales bacterium]|nr:hypothetical protein [Flavobacteriales bacterium]
MNGLRASEVEHLSRGQRTKIRNSWASDVGLARRYGVSVATIRKVRSSACKLHPARIAAIDRKWRKLGL